jgi:hypothetical protein
MASTIDSGVGYSSGFDMNGFNFDGVQGPGGAADGQVGPDYTDWWYYALSNYGSNNFSVPLGLPLKGNDGGNAMTIASFAPKFLGQSPNMYLFTDYYPTGVRSGFVEQVANYGGGNSRWNMNWHYQSTSAYGNYIGFFCSLPAE